MLKKLLPERDEMSAGQKKTSKQTNEHYPKLGFPKYTFLKNMKII